jgi:hypothetical protein
LYSVLSKQVRKWNVVVERCEIRQLSDLQRVSPVTPISASVAAAYRKKDPQTERAVRAFLADVALIIAEGAADWQLVGTLADLAYEVFLETGILIQPVPVSLVHWRHPERFSPRFAGKGCACFGERARTTGSR